jgi:hypothetical protein
MTGAWTNPPGCANPSSPCARTRRATSFVLPAAIYACIFYAAAAAMHFTRGAHGTHESVAMASDLFMALVLGAFAVASLIHSHP